MLKVSIKKSLLFAVLGIFILIASFIPGVNLAASFAASLILAFDSMDYSFESKAWDFERRKLFFKSEFPLFTGMALVMGLTLLIPGLTLLLYPVAVVGASSRLAHSRKVREGA